MKKSDLEKYRKFYEKFKKLNDEFYKECKRVKTILEDINEFGLIVGIGYIEYAERFKLDNDCVYWEGDEYWAYGGHEKHCGYFSVDYLTKTNEELRKIVYDMNKEYRNQKEQEEKEQEEKEKAKRFAEYEKLKKEFGD